MPPPVQGCPGSVSTATRDQRLRERRRCQGLELELEAPSNRLIPTPAGAGCSTATTAPVSDRAHLPAAGARRLSAVQRDLAVLIGLLSWQRLACVKSSRLEGGR